MPVTQIDGARVFETGSFLMRGSGTSSVTLIDLTLNFTLDPAVPANSIQGEGSPTGADFRIGSLTTTAKSFVDARLELHGTTYSVRIMANAVNEPDGFCCAVDYSISEG